MNHNYVYQGEEVELTGRTAKRRKVLRGKSKEVFDQLVEIQPIHNKLTESWKKWVNLAELYEITE